MAQTPSLHWVQSFAVQENPRNRCEAPRFNEAELKAFFLHDAKRVPEEGFAQRDWAGCYAEGFAVDTRGRRQLQWQLDVLGTGVITWPDGRVQHYAREQ
jgi:hypothetical protein